MTNDRDQLNGNNTPSDSIAKRANSRVDNDKGLLDVTKQAKEAAKRFNSDIEKLTKTNATNLTKIITDKYKTMYTTTLKTAHTNYLKDWVSREKKAVDTVVKYRSKLNSGKASSNSYGSSFSSQGLPKMLASEKKEKERLQAYEEALSEEREYSNKKAAADKLNINATKELNNQLKALKEQVKKGELTSSQAVEKSQELQKSFDRSTRGNKIAATTIESVITGFTSFVNIWSTRFQSGINNIYNTYESSFTKVATLMDINYSQYSDWQRETKKSLTADGLKNNIAISSIMKQLETTVGLGIVGDKAKQKALADTINQTLAPFVSTTTSAYTDLQMKLGDPFVQAVTSMSDNIARQVGSSRIMASSINEILTSLSPVILNAQDDYTTKHAGKAIAMTEAMVASGAVTQADATSLLYKIIINTTNPYEGLVSGNITSVAGLAGSKDMTKVEENLLSSLKFMSEMTNGVNDIIGRGAITSVTQSGMSPYSNFKGAYEVGAGIYGNYNDDSKTLYSNLRGRLANDELTTTMQERNIHAENSMLGFSQFKQRFPDAYKILNDISSKITKLIGATWTNSATNFLTGGGRGVGTTLKAGKALAGKAATYATTAGKTGQMAYYATKGGYTLTNATTLGKGAQAASAIGRGAGKVAQVGSKAVTKVGGASSVLGVLGGAATAAEGGYLATKEVMNASSAGTTANQKSVSTQAAFGYGTGAALGGASIAAFALGSNPIGWAVAALGALTIGVTKVYKAHNKQGEMLENLNNAYKEQISTMKDNKKANLEELDVFKDRIKEAKSIDEKQALAIEAGFTETEVTKMTKKRLDQVLDDFVDEQKKFEKDKFNSQKAALKDVQHDQATQGEKDKETNKELISKKLDSLDRNEAKKYLENMGVSDRFIKKFDKGNLSASEAASKKKYGFFGGNTGFDNLDSTTSNSMIDDLNITNGIKFKSDSEALAVASEFANAKATVTQYQRKGLQNLNAQEKYIYDIAHDTYFNKYKEKTPSARLDGHVSGLRYVSKDSTVNVHTGEGILTAAENSRYLSSKSQMASILRYNNYANNSPVIVDTESIVKAIKEAATLLVKTIFDTIPEKENNNVSNNRNERNKNDENLVRLRSLVEKVF